MILRTEELNNGYLQLVYIGLEYGQGGRDCHMKKSAMVIVSLRGIESQNFDSHSGDHNKTALLLASS